MVKWIKEIQRDMKIQTGKDIPEHEVMKVMLKEGSNLEYINIIYVGGGALILFCCVHISKPPIL